MCNISNIVNNGVLDANEAKIIFKIAKKKKFAIPAINCISTDSINIVLETAAAMKSPVIIQFSYGGSKFISGAGIKSKNLHKSAIIGAVSGANHVHLMAKYYKIPVILHTDHCPYEYLPWIDGLIKIGTKTKKTTGKPLFTSHMLDLSKEKIKKNIDICKKYLHVLTKLNMILELELGCTGGEEDGIDNSQINKNMLYTDTKDIFYAYKELREISNNFIIAAAFGNVHGVYKSGAITLKPSILKKAQKYISITEKLSSNPLNFVFHGGSGTGEKEIKKAIKYGVIKFNVDTDMQWSFWKGVLDFYKKNKYFLQTQIGNPEGTYKPNKKYYDPRNWLRIAQKNSYSCLKNIFLQLNSYNVL